MEELDSKFMFFEIKTQTNIFQRLRSAC